MVDYQTAAEHEDLPKCSETTKTCRRVALEDQDKCFFPLLVQSLKAIVRAVLQQRALCSLLAPT